MGAKVKTEHSPEEESKLRYQTYLDERKILVESDQVSADQLDKNILTLAGGALGLSIVFLEKIAPDPLPASFKFLYCSWAALLFSLLTMLSSFLSSQYAHKRQVKILEAEMFPDESSQHDITNCWSSATRMLNLASILSFGAGIVLLGVFSAQNVNPASHHKQQSQQQPTKP